METTVDGVRIPYIGWDALIANEQTYREKGHVASQKSKIGVASNPSKPDSRNHVSLMNSTTTRLLAVAAVALVAGCREEKIQVYEVPKERSAPMAAAPPSTPTMQLPEGWQPKPPGEMRLMSFDVKGEGGEADMSVTRAGGELIESVNRWRSAVSQKPLTSEDFEKSFTPLKVGRDTGKLFDIAGTSVEKAAPARVLAVVVDHDGATWYFKMMGDDKLVAAQKPAFVKFVQGFDFHLGQGGHHHGESAASSAADPHAGLNLATAPPTPESGPPPKAWPAPPTWQQQTPGMMQDAKFSVQGGKALVTVSSAGGDMTANIQRWRGQLQMAPASDAEVQKLAQPLDLAGVKATLVDLAGPKQRMIVVIVPKGEQAVFYKLMGDPTAVLAEKGALVEFVKKVK